VDVSIWFEKKWGTKGDIPFRDERNG
jgi:hypothetical protein